MAGDENSQRRHRLLCQSKVRSTANANKDAARLCVDQRTRRQATHNPSLATIFVQRGISEGLLYVWPYCSSISLTFPQTMTLLTTPFSYLATLSLTQRKVAWFTTIKKTSHALAVGGHRDDGQETTSDCGQGAVQPSISVTTGPRSWTGFDAVVKLERRRWCCQVRYLPSTTNISS